VVTLVVPAAVGVAAIQLVSSYLTRRKVAEVHVLVNSRLSDALAEVARLDLEVAALKESARPGGARV
jgi:hypothetical protein